MASGKPGRKSATSQRWVLIAGGLLVLVLLVVLMASTASVDSFLYLGLDTLKRGSLGRLDPDVPPALRDELRRAFDCVIAAGTSGRVGEDEIGAFARACRTALEDKVVTREEATRLRDQARSLCGAG